MVNRGSPLTSDPSLQPGRALGAPQAPTLPGRPHLQRPPPAPRLGPALSRRPLGAPTLLSHGASPRGTRREPGEVRTEDPDSGRGGEHTAPAAPAGPSRPRLWSFL